MTAHAATSQHIPALAPLEQYLEAHRTGKAEHIFEAFHADARIISFRDGVLHSLTVEEFSKRFQGQPQPDEAQRRRHIDRKSVV